MMAERIVDRLEMVEVEEQYRELIAAAACQRKQAFELLQQQHAVRQAGQRIVVRQIANPLFCLFALADVEHGAHAIADAVAHHGTPSELDRDMPAILVQQK